MIAIVVAGKTVTGIANAAVKRWLTRWLAENNATARLEKAWSEEFKTWVLERLAALEAQSRRLKKEIKKAPARAKVLDDLVSDRQFDRVQRNYEFEASREAMDERRRMLAYASAGSFTADMPLAMIARTERAMRELDPEGLVLLRSLMESAASKPGGDFDLEQAEANAHFDSLITSGCVRVSTIQDGERTIRQPRPVVQSGLQQGGTIRHDPEPRITIPRQRECGDVTTTGRAVLKILEGYTPTGNATVAHGADVKSE